MLPAGNWITVRSASVLDAMLLIVNSSISTLAQLEDYYDSAPPARSRVEEIGPFTLFVAESGWPYYARPRLGWSRKARPPEEGAQPPEEGAQPPEEGAQPPEEGAQPPEAATVDDVREVLSRQRQLGVPQALEWVDETTPGLVDVVRSAGAIVERCPLLRLDGDPVGTAGTARMLNPDNRTDIASTQAAIAVSFENGGTATGAAGLEARDEHVRSGGLDKLDHLEPLRERLAEGKVRMAAVSSPDAPHAGPVGGGSYIPVRRVAEIVGVGVLPAFRRRGLAGDLTYVLAQDALERGVTTVFCSAQSDDVARVYEAVGFRRVGTACIAAVEPAS